MYYSWSEDPRTRRRLAESFDWPSGAPTAGDWWHRYRFEQRSTSIIRLVLPRALTNELGRWPSLLLCNNFKGKTHDWPQGALLWASKRMVRTWWWHLIQEDQVLTWKTTVLGCKVRRWLCSLITGSGRKLPGWSLHHGSTWSCDSSLRPFSHIQHESHAPFPPACRYATHSSSF